VFNIYNVRYRFGHGAHSGVIDVSQVPSHPHWCLELFSVGWYAVNPQYRDSRGNPVVMALNVPRLAFGGSHVTTLRDYFFCAITVSSSVNTVSPSSFSCHVRDYIQSTVHGDTSQYGIVMACLATDQQVAKEHDLLDLYEDSSLLLAFCGFRRTGFQLGALYELKLLLQDQVDVRALHQC